MKKKLTLLIALSIIIGYFLMPITVVAAGPIKASSPDEVVIELEEEPRMPLAAEEETIIKEPQLKSTEEIVKEVNAGLWGNGSDRKQALEEAGYDYILIQSELDKLYPKVEVKVTNHSSGKILTARGGVVDGKYTPSGYKETWYSQRVLPGYGLNIPGRHIDSRGLVCDGNGYICVSVNQNDTKYPRDSLIETTLGTGKVYDCGCAPRVIDIYCNW